MEEAHSGCVEQLGLDPATFHVTSVEAIAEALRRAAYYFCPCASATLVRAVVEPMKGLVDEIDDYRESVRDTLNAMIGHGDLLEHRDFEDSSIRSNANLIYGSPLRFVVRDSGSVILLGVSSPRSMSSLNELGDRIEFAKHVRSLKPKPNEELRAVLAQLGIGEVSYSRWLRSPGNEMPAVHVSSLDQLLETGPPSGGVPDLSILDPERPVRYYRGRWSDVSFQTGKFVARRRQAYGSDLWCYVELKNGEAERLLDFPLPESHWRGCDEAWRLQMAIDAKRGSPQQFRLIPDDVRTTVVQLFSPIPAWAQRRWDAIGDPAENEGCLFAYRLENSELDEELRFARNTLWLAERV